MIFGTKPTYVFAVYNKKKMHSMGRAYQFDQAPVDIKECPVKIIDNKAEIFFPGPIFNTYVLSEEDKVTILKSYDDKLTFTKMNLDKTILHTVKTISEDEKTREVVLFEFDDFFPGFKTHGKVEYKNNKPIFKCKEGSGPLQLQNNEIKKETDAMLVHLGSEGPLFAEINNPVERTTVRIVKDLNNHKIVENENIKGILIGVKDGKIGEEVAVFVKNIYPGSYCFVEDIRPGIAEVQVVGKEGSIYKVKYKDFFGECRDKKVSKVMKGTIYDIKGATFKFKQAMDEFRTTDFETVSVPKRVKVSDESQIKDDQAAAIEFIRQKIEKGEDPKPLFNKYMNRLKENDSLCLFYLKYLTDSNISDSDVNKVMKCASDKFPKLVSESIDDLNVIRMVFNKKKTLSGFKRLLRDEKNKESFIKENPEFMEYSIGYIYESMEIPRVVVERVIDPKLKSWIEYAKHEEGNYKRSLFRRMAQMKFKKNEMKEVFKQWSSFEESVGGDVEEVHRKATEFVQGLEKQQ